VITSVLEEELVVTVGVDGVAVVAGGVLVGVGVLVQAAGGV
jgi:hypothetical protein